MILKNTGEEPTSVKNVSAYEQEQLHFIRSYDQLLHDTAAEDYEEYKRGREEQWTKPWGILEQYEADKKDGKAFTTLDLRPVIDAAALLGETTILEEVCRRTLELATGDHDAAHAHFYLGSVLSMRYDKECLPHLYKAVEANHNYFDEGYQMIGDFCIEMHLEEELKEYRNRFDKALQTKVDEGLDNMGILEKGDKLSEEHNLPAEEQKANIEFIKTVCGNQLQALYQVRKELSATTSVTFYVLAFKEETSEEVKEECYQKIFEYLDDLEWQYSLIDLSSVKGIKAEKLPGKIELDN